MHRFFANIITLYMIIITYLYAQILQINFTMQKQTIIKKCKWCSKCNTTVTNISANKVPYNISNTYIANNCSAWNTKLIHYYFPSHRVCKPAYLVPVPSQDKLGGLFQERHPAKKWWGWQRWGHQLVWMGWQSIRIVGASFCTRKTRRWQMYLLVPAHPGCLGQSPESWKMVVCVCVGAYRLLPKNHYCYHEMLTVFALVYIDMTADTNHSATPNLCAAHLITSLGTLSKLFPNPQSQNRASFI